VNHEGLVFYHKTDRLCIPEELQNKVLQTAYDSIIGGYIGINRTASSLGQTFFRPDLHQSGKQNVKKYAVCETAK
jgi:hypothetical protein